MINEPSGQSKPSFTGMLFVAREAVRAFAEAYGTPAIPFRNQFVNEGPSVKRISVEMPMTDEDRRVTYGELARRHAIPGAKKLAALAPSRCGFAPVELPGGRDCGRCMENDVSIRVVLDWPVMRLDAMVMTR